MRRINLLVRIRAVGSSFLMLTLFTVSAATADSYAPPSRHSYYSADSSRILETDPNYYPGTERGWMKLIQKMKDGSEVTLWVDSLHSRSHSYPKSAWVGNDGTIVIFGYYGTPAIFPILIYNENGSLNTSLSINNIYPEINFSNYMIPMSTSGYHYGILFDTIFVNETLGQIIMKGSAENNLKRLPDLPDRSIDLRTGAVNDPMK